MKSENLKDIFTREHIKYFKNNKHEITQELLETLRAYGNEGKHIAIEILDLEKDNENYYLDAFGNRVSFNGNRRIKKAFTKLDLHPIHIEELEKCSNDVHYFKDNYVKIKTKSGVNFPELRPYQNDFIELLSEDEEESIIGLMGRQSGKSISTSIYLSHLYCFDSEKNIGIVGNKGALAREFLSNVKNILIELPIWMQPGTKTWNKSFIEAENEMRVLTDVPSENAFRGFSVHCAVIDEAAFIRPNIYQEFIDSFLPSQSALAWKKNIIISTAKGMNHYYELVKGSSPKYETDGSGIKERGSNGYTLFKVDWRDVPRYDSKGNTINPEEFMNKIIAKHGILYWKQNYECIGGDSKVRVYDKFNKKYEIHNIINLKNIISEYITTDYTSRNYNSRYLIETINGYESFDNVISRGIKRTLLLRTENERIVATYNHKFVVKNTTIFASDLKIGDYLETKNGLESIIEISENGEVEVFDILNTESHTYLANNINNHNCNFLGSSHTLISSDKLKQMQSKEPEEIRDGKLKIYKYPEKGHKYILTVDPSMGVQGDFFAVQIVDITDIKFKQVATARLNEEYLKLPEFLDEWGRYFNNALIIIENNTGSGQSIADILYQTYEYENLYFDKETKDKKRKKYPGFRTTAKSRKVILDNLKMFIENDKFEINDSDTITEFFQFILVNNKYQADEGCHDDMIMSLALTFAIFTDTKNFEDIIQLICDIFSAENDESESEFSDYLSIGNFDDGYDEALESKNTMNWNGYSVEVEEGFY